MERFFHNNDNGNITTHTYRLYVAHIFQIKNSLKPTLILLGMSVKFISVIRGFVKYVIIIYQNWTIYTYVALVLKENTTHMHYKYPHVCEEIVYVLENY